MHRWCQYFMTHPARTPQDHLEAILFGVMRARGFGDEHVSRYRLVSQFFQQRRPLIVLICGVPCTGAAALLPPPGSSGMHEPAFW